MRVNLLFETRAPSWLESPDPAWDDRSADLELEHILNAMSRGDPLIRNVCRQVLDNPLQNESDILYRQEILQDCLAKPELIRKLYEICRNAAARRKKAWYRLDSPYMSTVYTGASTLLGIYMEALVEIRRTAENVNFASEGLQNLSRLLSQELSDAYLEELRGLRPDIANRKEMLISARFGPFLQGVSYVRRRPNQKTFHLPWKRVPSSFLPVRGTEELVDLSHRQDRAINEVANTMAQASDNVEAFTRQLQMELAFYVGAMNLHERMKELELPVSVPVPCSGNTRCWRGLYDGSLALLTRGAVTANTLSSRDRPLYLITGANQGGKTTFLRSVGQCQLMAQGGLFVFAEECQFPIRTQLYTHFKREEDPEMTSGRLDEELDRMSGITDRLRPGGMVLSNESFSSTNDPEGSRIFEQITLAFLERKIELFSVTHLMNYAARFAGEKYTLCLRAQRTESGERTFRLEPGKPLITAYGEDIYRRIFCPGGTEAADPAEATEDNTTESS